MPKKILLADDSVTIQKVVELTFAEGDYEVTSVGNGRAALEKLKESRPDILLCDIIMPEVSGYEVAEFVKRNPTYSAIPVILLTGTFEPFDEEKARQSGADTFITKPFDSRMLVEKVESLLKQRLVLEDAGPTAMEVLTGQGGAMTVGGNVPSSLGAVAPPPVPESPPAPPTPPAMPESEAAAFEAADAFEAFAPAASPFEAAASPFEAAGSPFEAAAPAVPEPPQPAEPAPPAPVLETAPPPAAPVAEVPPAEPEVEDLSALAPSAIAAGAFDAFAEPPAPPVPSVQPEEVSLPPVASTPIGEEALAAEGQGAVAEISGAEDWGAAAATAGSALPPLPPFVESEGPEPEVESTPWSDVPAGPVSPAEGIVHEMTEQQEMVSEAHQAEIFSQPAAPREPEPEPEVPAAIPAAPEPVFESESDFVAEGEAETEPEAEPELPREPSGPAAAPAVPAVAPSITAEQVEAIVRKVVAEMAPDLVRQVAWEVIPELAESVIRRRIQELESQVE